MVACADIAGLWPFSPILPSSLSFLAILGTVLGSLRSIAHGLFIWVTGSENEGEEVSTDFIREDTVCCVNKITSCTVSPFPLAAMLLLFHWNSPLGKLKA
jgi:hypothetical protein